MRRSQHDFEYPIQVISLLIATAKAGDLIKLYLTPPPSPPLVQHYCTTFEVFRRLIMTCS